MKPQFPDQSEPALRRVRALDLQAMGATTVAEADTALSVIAQMRWLVVDVSSAHGEFRQLFDLGLNDAESWIRIGDFSAATTALESARRLVIKLEQTLERP